jgi:DNA-binding Lrp family transcriptional regulator
MPARGWKRWRKTEPQVQQFYHITGEVDFALIGLARDMQGFQEFTQRLFFNGSHVKRLRTSVVMDRTKAGMAVPV